MTKYNPKNERIKHQYGRYLAEADGKSTATIDGIQKAILRLEQYTKFKDFRTFNQAQAIAFKENLAKTKTERTGEPLSVSTMHSTLTHLKNFFKWLALIPGYKSKINLLDIEYFNLTNKETRAAKAPKYKKIPTLDQIRKVIAAMPDDNDINKRNRALVACTILTGIRVDAMTSLKLGHVDLEAELVKQDPREVKTKFSKAINTFFFPVGDEIKQIVIDWVNYRLTTKLHGYHDPLFPKPKMEQGADRGFKAVGLSSEHWSSTGPIREIFRNAFEAVGLEYYNPHSFRDTLVQLGKKRCKTMEEMKAWSQNLGHESISTTLDSYGNIDVYRQGDVLRSMKGKD